MNTQHYDKILIVDEDPNILNLLKYHLISLESHVATAKNGSEARAILKTDHYPLIISDMHLPGMNGFEFLEYVKENHKETQVMIMTGDDDKPRLADLFKAGAYDYIQKPFSPFEVEAKLQKFLREQNLLKEMRQKERLYRTLVESSPT